MKVVVGPAMAVLRVQHGLMPRPIAGSAPLLALAFLAIAPRPGTAMEATCAGCLDNCCQWAFAARQALYGTYSERMPIDAYSWQRWERHGFPPAPCREDLDNWAEYERCAWKAFSRCYKSRCTGCGVSWFPLDWISRPGHGERQRRSIGGTKPVERHAGQVIVIDKDVRETHGTGDSKSGAGQRQLGRPPRRP